MNKTPLIIYSPESLVKNPVNMLKGMFHDLSEGRELAWRLTVRDLSAQYRLSILGFMWVLILPMANTFVWIILSKSGIVKISDTGIPYPVYVFVGTMLWAIFMEAVNAPLHGTLSSRSMLAKINFPREAIIVAGIYQTLLNAGIKMVLIMIALIIIGVFPGWSGLLIPFGILSIILVGTAIGIMITPVGLLYSDVGKAIPLFMQFLMYLTPVVFPLPKQGWAATLFNLNPLTPVIQTVRDWITCQTPAFLLYFAIVNLVAIFLLLVVWVIYRLAMPILIERMSA